VKKLSRGCWWCGKALMAVSHAVLPDGRWVHKVCEKDALASLKPITARPTQSPYDTSGLKEYPGE